MSEQITPEDAVSDQEAENANLQHLRDKAARVDVLEAEAAQRNIADKVRAAGGDPESELGKIAAAALTNKPDTDIGPMFATPPEAQPPPPITDEEKAVLAGRQTLATGADGASAPAPEDPYSASGKVFDTAFATFGREKATTDAFASLRAAAEAGDTRAVFDPSNPLRRYGASG